MAIDPDAPFTELEAVNEMLRDVGARTVTSLSGTLRRDVQMALDTLRRTTRTVCQRGHWFNTARKRLAPNGSDRYEIDPTWVHVEVEADAPTSPKQYSEPIHLVVTGNGSGGRVLYDRANNNDTFVGGPTIQLVVHLLVDYVDLPNSARELVYTLASIRFQSRELGSRAVSAELREQAEAARALLTQEDVDNENINLTTSPRFVTMMWDA